MRVAEGSNPSGDYDVPHAYSKNWETYKESVFGFNYSNGAYAGTCTISNGGFGVGAHPSPWTAAHDYKLLSRMRSKVVGTEFNLASFLGAEGRDTIRFFTDTATRIYKSALYVRKLQFAKAHKVLFDWGRFYSPKSKSAKWRTQQEDVYRDIIETVTNRSRGSEPWIRVLAKQYLEWHLAVEPLLSDCVAAAEQLAHTTQMPRTQKVRATVLAKSSYPKAVSGPDWAGTREVRKSIVAYFVSTPQPLSFLGFQDPEVTLWNALPLSFVSDYFYDIGGFLEARASAKALGQGTYITTLKDDARYVECYGTRFNNKPWLRIINGAGKAQNYRKGSITRSISSILDVPKPLFEPLGAFKSWQRAATVASLFTVFSTPRNDVPVHLLR